MLGPATLGILGAVTQFTSVVNRFASFRIDELVIRYVGHYEEKGDHPRAAVVFKTAAALEISGSLLAFILIWFLAPLGAQIFAHDSSLVGIFRLYGLIVLANLIYESATGVLQIFDRFRWIAIVTTVQAAATLTFIFIAFLTQGGLSGVVLAYMIGKIVGAVSLSAAALWQAQQSWGAGWLKTPFNLLKTERRSLLTFAFSTNLSSTISLISKDSEMLWVAAFLGTEQAGYYKIALAMTSLLHLPISPLPKATFPELTREIARKNWENVRYVLKQGSRLAAAYSLPVMTGLILLGKPLISLIYTAEYLPSYPALVLLVIGYTFSNIFYWNRVALLSLARPVFPTLVNFTGMVFKVGLIFLLVPYFGYLAFAALLSGYYIYTVGIAAARVYFDLKSRALESSTVNQGEGAA